MLKQWIGGYDRFVILALLGLFVIWQWGNSKVYRLNRVWTTDINGGVALVSKYGENLVCVPVINNELVLDGKFSLIKITDAKPVDFKQAIIKSPRYQLFSTPPTAKIKSSPDVSPNSESPSTIPARDGVVPNKPESDNATDEAIDQREKVQERDKSTKAGPVPTEGGTLQP